MLAVSHWEDARKVLLNETHRQRVPIFTKHLEAVAQYNILTLKDREWKVQRTAIARAFQSTYNLQYRSTMTQVVGNLATALKQKMAVEKSYSMDMEALMKMCTLDVFALAAMGLDFGCCKTLESFPLANKAEFLNAEVIRRIKRPLDPFCYFYCLPSESNRKWHDAAKSIKAFFGGRIQERKEQATMATSSTKDNKNMDLFARLVKGHAFGQKEMPGVVPDSALLDLVIAVMFAGFETTAVTLSYSFYLLDKHPEVQEICLREIQSLDKLDDPKDLPYCEAVIMEALRLYPAAVATSRTIQRSLELSGGFVAEKGTTIFVPIWTLNRNERSWPQPDSFCPDRWVKRTTRMDRTLGQWVQREESDTSGTIAAANRKAIFTFSAGGRSCPGQSFAMQEAVLVLAGLLKDFKFTTSKGYKVVPVREGITQHPKGGIPMNVELRL